MAQTREQDHLELLVESYQKMYENRMFYLKSSPDLSLLEQAKRDRYLHLPYARSARRQHVFGAIQGAHKLWCNLQGYPIVQVLERVSYASVEFAMNAGVYDRYNEQEIASRNPEYYPFSVSWRDVPTMRGYLETYAPWQSSDDDLFMEKVPIAAAPEIARAMLALYDELKPVVPLP